MKLFHPKKLLSLLAAAALLAGALAGCGGADPIDEAQPALEGGATTATAPAGGDPDKLRLAIGVTSFADTLETTDQYFSWVVMRYGIGETLVHFSDSMGAEPWLAESWELADDLVTWTFKIRDGIRFSNGNTLTAELVRASIERTFDKSRRAGSEFFQYEEMTADGNILTIKTVGPVPSLPGCLADPLFIIVDTTENTDRYAAEGPVATGPYVATVFNKEQCVLVRNEYYWDGAVPYDEVAFLAIDDVNTRTMSLQAGEIDIGVNIGSSDLQLFTDESTYDMHTIASLRTVLSFMNQDGPLGDKLVRQAVIRGLDRETYANVLLNGTFVPGKAPIPNSLDYGFDQLTESNPYDPESAKALLAEAGYVDTDGDGIVEKDGVPLTLRYVIYDSREELPVLAEATQVSLKEIGIDVKIENYEYTTLLEMQENGEYDLLIWNTTTANTGDPADYLRAFWRTQEADAVNSNTAGYSNAQVDAIIDGLRTEFDTAKRREMITEAQQLIMDDAASIFYAYPETNIISRKNVDGVRMLPADYYWLTKDIRPAA